MNGHCKSRQVQYLPLSWVPTWSWQAANWFSQEQGKLGKLLRYLTSHYAVIIARDVSIETQPMSQWCVQYLSHKCGIDTELTTVTHPYRSLYISRLQPRTFHLDLHTVIAGQIWYKSGKKCGQHWLHLPDMFEICKMYPFYVDPTLWSVWWHPCWGRGAWTLGTITRQALPTRGFCALVFRKRLHQDNQLRHLQENDQLRDLWCPSPAPYTGSVLSPNDAHSVSAWVSLLICTMKTTGASQT